MPAKDAVRFDCTAAFRDWLRRLKAELKMTWREFFEDIMETYERKLKDQPKQKARK